ncbi:MAG: TRAP transporter small permease [Marivibrio sp.]|uniref:TRAP transporter small permease n=1 Tax=Marivibrio sp. TaxID=2039719 RepID=UPI0032EE837D
MTPPDPPHRDTALGGGARRIARAFARAMERTTRLFAGVGIAALAVAIGLVVVDVAWRRIGSQSLIGAVDLTQLCVMAAAFLSIPYAFMRGAHVTVDLFASRFGPRATRLLDAAGAALSAALVAFLLYLSWGRAMEQWRYGDVSQDLAIPMIAYWAFVLLGFALSALAALSLFLERLTAGEARG